MKIQDLSYITEVTDENTANVHGGDAISDYINSIPVPPQYIAAARQNVSQLNFSLLNSGGAYAINNYWTNLGVGIATGQIQI
jgi:hypothetical protein